MSMHSHPSIPANQTNGKEAIVSCHNASEDEGCGIKTECENNSHSRCSFCQSGEKVEKAVKT